jgi:uncharacterized membrane protein YhfC
MVNSSTFIYLVVSILLCFGFPLILFLVLRKKASNLLVPLLAGGVGFFVMQVVIRIPILSIIGISTGLYEVNIFILAFILGFSAALFETFGRVITVKLFMKKDHRFLAGIAHGIGHGGIEAIVLVGLNYVFYVIYAAMINNGTFDALLGLDESYQALKNILLDTSSLLFLLGGIERVLTIIFHISISVLVVYAFRIKKKSPVIVAIVIHTLLDFSIVIMSHYGLNAYVIETYILVIVLLMTGVIYYIFKKYLEMKEDGDVYD